MGNLKNLIGIIKDTVSQSKAAVVSNPKTLTLHLSILRATSHDLFSPPNPKHLAALLSFGHGSRATAASVIEALMDRLQATRDAAVAIKCLITVHHIIKHGSFILQDQLSVYPAAGGRNHLKLSDFRDHSTPIKWELSSWVRWYALYLEHLLSTSRILGFFLSSISRTNSDQDKQKDAVSMLLNKDLISDLNSLVGLLEEICKRPDFTHVHENKLVEAVMELAREDYLTAVDEVSVHLNESRQRLSCLSFADSVELVCALKRLEGCKEGLSVLSNRKRVAIETLWGVVSELKDKVGEEKVYREERKLLTMGVEVNGSESARYDDRVVIYDNSVRFASGRFGLGRVSLLSFR